MVEGKGEKSGKTSQHCSRQVMHTILGASAIDVYVACVRAHAHAHACTCLHAVCVHAGKG